MAKHLAENCLTWFAPAIRRRSLKSWSLTLAFAAAMVSSALAQTVLPDLSHHLTQIAKPQPAKNFSFKDLDGKTRSLSDYRGKVVLVNFWATWCPPCRREMPSLERLNQKLQGEPFIILAVDQWESYDLVFAFTGQLDPQPTFPILFDSKSQASKQWDVKGLPASFIVDKQGRVVYRAMGGREFDHPEIEQLIRKLLKE